VQLIDRSKAADTETLVAVMTEQLLLTKACQKYILQIVFKISARKPARFW